MAKVQTPEQSRNDQHGAFLAGRSKHDGEVLSRANV